MKIFVSLVGEQPTPNLIQLFDKKALEGPEDECWGAVKFLVSNDTEQVGENLLQALASDPTTSHLERMKLDRIEAWSLENARKNILCAIEDVEKNYPSNTIVVNFTGGTKIMSLAAYQVAMEMGLEMMYVNTEREILLEFDSSGKQKNAQPFRVAPSLKTLLLASGRVIDETKTGGAEAIDSKKKDLAVWIAKCYEDAVLECLMPVQKSIQEGLNNQKTAPFPPPYRVPLNPTTKGGKDAAQYLKEQSLWNWDGRTVSVEKNWWNFIGGGQGNWLEIFSVANLDFAKPKFDDVLGPVQLRGVTEIDAMACRNGRLAILECKLTGSKDEGGVTNLLGKLKEHEHLLGGLYGAAVFVRAYEDKKADGDLRRWAQEYGVTVVIGRELPNLADIVFKAVS